MAVQAILDSLEAYTGELDSLNAFVETAAGELGPDWTNKIYESLGSLSDYQKEKLDHAFNYYAAVTAWNEIQGYLTHDGPLNYRETVDRLPVLEHWLAFFGAAGEEVVSSLKSRLKLEGAAAAFDTSVLDDPFVTAPTTPIREETNLAVQPTNVTNETFHDTQNQNNRDTSLQADNTEQLTAPLTSNFNGNGVENQVPETSIQNEGMQEGINQSGMHDNTAEEISDAISFDENQSQSNVSEFALDSNQAEPISTQPQTAPNDMATLDESQKGVFINDELETNGMQQRINDIFTDDPSFEETHKIVARNTNLTAADQTVEPDAIIDTRPAILSPTSVQGDVTEREEQKAEQGTSDDEQKMDNIFEESDLNEFFQAVDPNSAQATPQIDSANPVEMQEYTTENIPNSADDAEFVSLNETAPSVVFSDQSQVLKADEQDSSFVEPTLPAMPSLDIEEAPGDVSSQSNGAENMANEMTQESNQQSVTPPVPFIPTQSIDAQGHPDVAPTNRQAPLMESLPETAHVENTVVPPIHQNMSVPDERQVNEMRLTAESEQEFQISRLYRQIDFKTAVQAWISARCIELGYTNNYTYRYYGFLVDVMDRTIEEIKAVLDDDTLLEIVEQRKQGGIHYLQNQLLALEKESKDAHDRITSDLSPLPREGLSTDDVRKALGQMDLSGEKEYLGPAPDGFEMLEDPYQNLDEATVKKEYAKIEAEADLPPAEPIKSVDPDILKKPTISVKNTSQTPQNGVQRKLSFSFGKKTTPTDSDNT